MKTIIGNIGQKVLPHGQLRLSEETVTTLTLADTYYKIAGVMTDGHSKDFIITDNKLVYTGKKNICCLFVGASDLRVNKACEIVYSLYKKDVLVPQAQTPHTFVASARTSTISITAIVEIVPGDYFDVHIKSSEALTLADIKTLNITLWADRF